MHWHNGRMRRSTERTAEPAVRLLAECYYAELQQMARRQRTSFPARSETLRTTALVHEAYLKLSAQLAFRDHGHFLACAALAMRQALVDDARRRLAERRGAGAVHLPLESAGDVADAQDRKLLELDDALFGLENHDQRLAQVVECRFFAGYTDAETAQALGVTERTVQRDWTKARALLYEALGH